MPQMAKNVVERQESWKKGDKKRCYWRVSYEKIEKS